MYTLLATKTDNNSVMLILARVVSPYQTSRPQSKLINMRAVEIFVLYEVYIFSVLSEATKMSKKDLLFLFSKQN